jgi:plastocyanin
MNTKTTFMFTRRLAAAFAIILSVLACSAGDTAEANGAGPPMNRAGQASAGREGAPGGSSPTEAGSSSDAESASAGQLAGGAAGADTPMSDQGGDEEVSAGGAGGNGSDDAGGEATAGTGGEPPKPLYVNGCFAYVDRTDEGARRTIVWDDALIFNPARCMRVRVGQTVTFAGDHGNHPLMPKGGDTPSPVGPTSTFNVTGIFGYECIPHPSEMNGAIEVIP